MSFRGRKNANRDGKSYIRERKTKNCSGKIESSKTTKKEVGGVNHKNEAMKCQGI